MMSIRCSRLWKAAAPCWRRRQRGLATVAHRRHSSSGDASANHPSAIRRIILVRHGESAGNIDERAYGSTADWRIPLTERGREQAQLAGRRMASYLSSDDDATGAKGKVYFYVSPYLRTRQTLREMLREVDPESVVGIREDPRIAEQQFGNFQSHGDIQDSKAERTDFGRFFYRFPDGESGFDVYHRVSGFIGTMQRDSSQVLEPLEEDATVCLVTHGLALRLFLMRWFQYTVMEFERSYNPENGSVVVLEPPKAGGAGFELSEEARVSMGFPRYWEQERFQLMEDYCLLEKTEW
ncbi:hypothetical protein ACHAXT_005572 [Thalassiosira profunda]